MCVGSTAAHNRASTVARPLQAAASSKVTPSSTEAVLDCQHSQDQSHLRRYLKKSVYTQELLHRRPFTHKSFYTENHFHIGALAQKTV